MNKFTIVSIVTFPIFLITLLTGLHGIAFLTLTFWLAFTAVAVCSLKSGIFGPAVTKKPESQSVFLTFDDGPDPELTPKVLDLLKEKGITATFFLIADKAQKQPELVKRMVEEGHTIGSHDLTHPWWANFRTTPALRRDISKSVEILESLSGKKISLYRPPVGLSNPHAHKVCRELNLTIIGWTRSSRDGGNRSKNAISHLAAIPVMRGEIILMHDTAPVGYHGKLFLGSLETLISRIKKERLTTESL